MAARTRGTEVILSGTFRDSGANLADPTEVTLEVLRPGSALTTYTYGAAQVTRASLGVYTRLQTLDKSGPWYYRFTATGALTVSDWRRIDVIDDPLD